METKQQNSYFDELGLRLKKDGFTVLSEENGILPIRLDNRPLCCVTDVGAVRYREEDIANEKAAQACDRVMDIAAETAEYVRQMESAPFLKVGSPEGNYKLLAEFNGTVLAGHSTRYGMEFITWDLIQNNTALWQGHYYSSYTAAKQDFASRAGLIDKHQLFSPEQLTEIYRSIHETLDEAYPITEERNKLLESAAEQIEYAVPDLDKRVQESNQKEMEVAEQGPQPSIHCIEDWALTGRNLAEVAVWSWSASAGHLKNMTTSRYGSIGIGLARGTDENGDPCWYCAQLFMDTGCSIGRIDTPATTK